jgi:hypothetical protein
MNSIQGNPGTLDVSMGAIFCASGDKVISSLAWRSYASYCPLHLIWLYLIASDRKAHAALTSIIDLEQSTFQIQKCDV